MANEAPHRSDHEEGPRARDPFERFGETERREVLEWVGQHLPYVQATAAGQRPIYWILGVVLVVGLIAQIGAYLLRTTTTGEPLGVIADLLHALGYSLWTGVVVVVCVQILPEAKRRQYEAALRVYEEARSQEARAQGDDGSTG